MLEELASERQALEANNEGYDIMRHRDECLVTCKCA